MDDALGAAARSHCHASGAETDRATERRSAPTSFFACALFEPNARPR